MRNQGWSVLVLLCGVSAAQAQQWPGYHNTRYYQQPPVQRYYYPAANGGHYGNGAAPSANYYGAPPANYYRAAPSPTTYYAAPQPNNSPYYFAPSAGTVVSKGNPPSLPATSIVSPEVESKDARFPKTAPIIAQELPTSPPALPENKGNVGLFWQKMVEPQPNNSPSYFAPSADTVFSKGNPPSPPATSIVSPEVESKDARFPKTAPIIAQELPTSPPALPENKWNVERLWQKMVDAIVPTSPPGVAESVSKRSREERFWVSANYLGGFLTPMRLAGPLVTTGSLVDVNPGALGQPSTGILYGNRNVDFGLSSGFELKAGVFLDQQDRLSLDWSWFMLFPGTQSFSIVADSNGLPFVARPVFATDLGRQAVFLNSAPGLFSGSLVIDTKSQLGGTEFNIRSHRYYNDRFHADALVGLRYLRLAEQMQFREEISGLNGTTVPFNGQAFASFSDEDTFATSNRFFGAQAGGRVRWESDWLTVTGFAKLGLGATMEQVNINGSTTFLAPSGNQTASGGVLALPSNIGNHNRTVFGILPEFGLNAGVNVTSNARINLGYSALFWNKVVRPGMQYDTTVNTALAPTAPNFGNVGGASAPVFRFNDEFFWTQTFNLGLEFHY